MRDRARTDSDCRAARAADTAGVAAPGPTSAGTLSCGGHPRSRIERYLAYERYLLHDLFNFVKGISGSPTMGVTGCSFGAYHALTMALRHPDVITSCIAMGGAFDIARFLDGYSDLDSYL